MAMPVNRSVILGAESSSSDAAVPCQVRRNKFAVLSLMAHPSHPFPCTQWPEYSGRALVTLSPYSSSMVRLLS